jgi:DNA-3-methyladenine glycosylase I
MTTTRTTTSTRATQRKRPVADGSPRQRTREKPSVEPTANQAWYHFYAKGDPEYENYMATEWGFEKRGDQALFEKLSLEGAQSGLSWLTILRKREAYRRTFHQFDPVKIVTKMDNEEEVGRILATTGESSEVVVRHRGKIESVINNAKCLLNMREEEGEKQSADNSVEKEVFDDFLWSFVDQKPILNRFTLKDMPAKSEESEAMSKALKKRGFKFVGPTTCYALMQSVGMVIDHPVDSPEWKEARLRLQNRPGGYQERLPRKGQSITCRSISANKN